MIERRSPEQEEHRAEEVGAVARAADRAGGTGCARIRCDSGEDGQQQRGRRVCRRASPDQQRHERQQHQEVFAWDVGPVVLAS